MEDTKHTSSSPSTGSGSGTTSHSTTTTSTPSSTPSSTPNSTHDNPANSSPTSNNSPVNDNSEKPDTVNRHSNNNTMNTNTSTGQVHSDSTMSNPVNDKVDTSEKSANSAESNSPYDLSYFEGIYKTKEKDPLDLSYFESPYDKNKIEDYLKRNVETGNQLAYNEQDFIDSMNRIDAIQPRSSTLESLFETFDGVNVRDNFENIKDDVKSVFQSAYNDVNSRGTVNSLRSEGFDYIAQLANNVVNDLSPGFYDSYREAFEKLKREVEFAKEKADDIRNNGVTKNTGISAASEKQQIEGQLAHAKSNLTAAYASGDPTAIERAKQNYERVADRVKQNFEGSTVMENIWRNESNPETLFNRMEETYGAPARTTTPRAETPARTEPARTETPTSTPVPTRTEPTRTESVPETPRTSEPETPARTEETPSTSTPDDLRSATPSTGAETTEEPSTSETEVTSTETEIPEEISETESEDTRTAMDYMEDLDDGSEWWKHGSATNERVRRQIKRVSPSAEKEFMDFAQNIDDILNGTAGQKVKAVLKLISRAAWDTFTIIPKVCGDMVKDTIYRLIKGDYDTSGLSEAEQKQVKRFAQNKKNVAMMNSMLDTMDKPIESSVRGKGRGQATDESDYNEGMIEDTNDVVSDVTKKYIINNPWVFKAIQRW